MKIYSFGQKIIFTYWCINPYSSEFGGDEEVRYKGIPLNSEEELNGSGNDSNEIENTNDYSNEELERRSRQLSKKGTARIRIPFMNH